VGAHRIKGEKDQTERQKVESANLVQGIR